MPDSPARDALATHEVTNQPAPRGDLDLWGSDPGLQTHARAAGADADHLADYGTRIGTQAMQEAGRAARRHAPELVAFDAGGRRLDEGAVSSRAIISSCRPGSARATRPCLGKGRRAAMPPMPRWST